MLGRVAANGEKLRYLTASYFIQPLRVLVCLPKVVNEHSQAANIGNLDMAPEAKYDTRDF